MDRDEYDYEDRNAGLDEWNDSYEDELFDDDDSYDGNQKRNKPQGNISEEQLNTFDSTREWGSNGLPGKIFGTIAGLGAALAQIIRVTVMNLILGKHEQYAIRDAFMRAFRGVSPELEEQAIKTGKQNDLEMKKDGQEQREPQQAKETTEQAQTGKGSDEIRNADNALEKNTSWRPDPKDIPEEMTAEAVEKMLSDAQVKDVFARAGLGAEPAGVDDKIYLIRHGDNGLNKSVFAMYKTDLLSGDAKNLASAIYAYDGGDKKNCALKAAMIVAASSYLANSKDFGDAQMKGETPVLSYVHVETPSGAQMITVQGSRSAVNAVDITADGKAVATLPVDTLASRPYQEYGSQILGYINHQDKDNLTFGKPGNEITLIKSDDGILVHTTVEQIGKDCAENSRRIEDDLGPFRFEDEQDVAQLAKQLFDSPIRLGEPEAVAYAVAMVSNPDMMPAEDGKGMYLNPIKGDYEEAGSSHLFLEHTEKGVSLKLFLPKDDTSWDMLKIGGWKSFVLLNSKVMMELIGNISEARKAMDETTVSVTDYDRQLETKETKGDYFDVPVVGTPDVAKELKQVHKEKLQFDHFLEDGEFVIPEGMEDVVKQYGNMAHREPEPLESQEEDPYLNVSPADIPPEIEAELPEAREEEMVDYEPGVPDLDECDR